MNAYGWTLMSLSVATVLMLVSYCLGKVLSLPPLEVEESVRGPLEIDTEDTGDAD